MRARERSPIREILAEEDPAGAGRWIAEQREQVDLPEPLGPGRRRARRPGCQVDAAQRDHVVPADPVVEVDDSLAADPQAADTVSSTVVAVGCTSPPSFGETTATKIPT